MPLFVSVTSFFTFILIIVVDNDEWEDIVTGSSTFKEIQEASIPNFDISQIHCPSDIFSLFISDEIVDLIVEETNRYAQQCLSQNRSVKSRVRAWVDTNKVEMRKFFAVVLTMGLNRLPYLHMYWSKDSMFRNEFIANIMTRDRFLLLLRYIHFCDNEDENLDKSNRLFKVENVIKLVNANFKKVLTLGKKLVIDETMVPFRGRLRIRQYIPNKTHKYGIKLYKLCTIDGYTGKIIVYTGKNEKTPGQSHSENIVLSILDCIDDKEGHYVFADNFYTSFSLARKLFEKKMTYCGTLRRNRKGIPKDFYTKKLKKGEICGKQKGCVKIIKWLDKRPVCMLTTDPTHDLTMAATGRLTRTGEDVLKPKCVIAYNKAKKGVDLSDQMSSYHSALRKGLKWYRKLMFELLFGTCVVNAWVINNTIFNNKLSITEFRRKLARELAEPPLKRNTSVPKRTVHTFVKPSGPGRKKRKMCKGCYEKLRETLESRQAKNKVTKVTSFCNDCPNQPGMCLPCFNKLHA